MRLYQLSSDKHLLFKFKRIVLNEIQAFHKQKRKDEIKSLHTFS